jgi:hypothetical protein
MMFRIVLWDVLPCKMIVDRRSRGAYCLHPLKRLSTIILYGSTSQKTILNKKVEVSRSPHCIEEEISREHYR